MPMELVYLGNAPDLFKEDLRPAAAASAHGAIATRIDTLGDCVLIRGLSAGERVFVIRANDATSIATLNHYLLMQDGAISDDKTRGIEEIRTDFMTYQRAHRSRVKLPD